MFTNHGELGQTIFLQTWRQADNFMGAIYFNFIFIEKTATCTTQSFLKMSQEIFWNNILF